MDNINADSQEAKEEIMPLPGDGARRQRQQLRFAQEEEKEKPKEEENQQKLPSSFKPPGRASRFLSVSGSSFQSLGTSLIRLRRLHNKATKRNGSLVPEEITDEMLDKMSFKIIVIPDRRDDFKMEESALTKRHQKNKEPMEMPTDIPSGLSPERRLEIIEEVLRDLSQINVLDETRRANSIPFRLPKRDTNNQMQKNVAERIRDLTGSETIMLNDHLYMENLCKRLNEKHKEELEANFKRIASNDKHRYLSELTD